METARAKTIIQWIIPEGEGPRVPPWVQDHLLGSQHWFPDHLIVES